MSGNFPFRPPQRRAIHECKAVSSSYQQRNVIVGTLRVDGSLLVEQVMDGFAVK